MNNVFYVISVFFIFSYFCSCSKNKYGNNQSEQSNSSCQEETKRRGQCKQDDIKMIKIYYSDFDILTFVTVHCDRFLSALASEIEMFEITDSLRIKKMNTIMSDLIVVNDSVHCGDVDVRAKIDIISSLDTISICLDYFVMEMSGVKYHTSPALIDFIKSLEPENREKNL